MDDLRGRFGRLDRIATPNLWNEAVGRAAELERTPRRAFTPAMGLIAAALLLAALGGTLAVGALLDESPPDLLNVNYDNGVLTLNDGCGGVVGLDPTSYRARDLVVTSADCPFGGWDGPAAWSTDGRWMAYPAMARGTEVPGAWLYDAESGEARHLGSCPAGTCGDLDISPDGSLISFLTVNATEGREVHSMVADYGLTLVETATGTAHHLDLPGVAGRPSFSPEGDRIALTLQGGQSGVHVIDVADVMEGEFPERSLVHGIVEATNGVWSPNGTWIAVEVVSYRDAGEGRSTLWIVRADGSGARQLTTIEDDGRAYGATWSPDSSTIAYIAMLDDESGQSELRTIPIDGGTVTRVRDFRCCSWSAGPAWSPDGEWIALGVTGEGDDEGGLMLVRPDGTDARLVSDLEIAPVWQPIPKD
jgi:Tol biopolymer transport system component